MRAAKCRRCGGDICFTWDSNKNQWWPTEIASLSGEETPFKNSVYRHEWNRTHKCSYSSIDVPNPSFAVLHLLPTAPPEVIKAVYRVLASIHHPDKGGDMRKMQAINAAYEALQ